MGAEVIIIGSRELPAHVGQWNRVFKGPHGSIEINEIPKSDHARNLEFAKAVGLTIRFQPRSIVTIRKAWDAAFAVSDVIARSVAGLYFDDASGELANDFSSTEGEALSIAELETKCQQAFADPAAYLSGNSENSDEEPKDPDFQREWSGN